MMRIEFYCTIIRDCNPSLAKTQQPYNQERNMQKFKRTENLFELKNKRVETKTLITGANAIYSLRKETLPYQSKNYSIQIQQAIDAQSQLYRIICPNFLTTTKQSAVVPTEFSSKIRQSGNIPLKFLMPCTKQAKSPFKNLRLERKTKRRRVRY